MRVDSIIAINANQQKSPKANQYESLSSNNNVTGISFEEYLREKLQQTNNPATTRYAENQVVGLMMGYFSNLRLLNKTEPKLENNAI